jgi:hypothetical protein
MKKLNYVKIDFWMTVASYLLTGACFLLLAGTRISSDVCFEGFLLAAYILFARDMLSYHVNRRRLKKYGFE